MDPLFEEKYHRIEQDHWWFRARREAILRLMQTIAPDARILDIGCSGGNLLALLQSLSPGRVWGADLSLEALRLCQKAGLSTIQMDAATSSFRDNSLDLIIASDIIEHLPDDCKALRDWHRILKPGGRILIFVPAFPFLWSNHDVVNHHFRRYTPAVLRSKATQAGFRIRRADYWNFAAFFPVVGLAMVRRAFGLVPKMLRNDNFFIPPAWLNLASLFWMRLENFIFCRLPLPVGLSVFIDARKDSVHA